MKFLFTLISRFFLLPFSILYLLVVCLRNRYFDWFPGYKAPVPIISIGNISVGGTGKTPLAAYLIRFLLSNGYRPAYLSRGYGRKSKGLIWVDPTNSSTEDVGDEALQMAHNFPGLALAVCEKRQIGIEAIWNTHKPDCIILDDAFQHRSVTRDLDIVVLDAGKWFKGDLPLPAGRLREPAHSLYRADYLVVNKLSAPDQIQALEADLVKYKKAMGFCTIVPGSLRPFTTENPLPSNAKKIACIVFSGIGNPGQFVNQTQAQGIAVLAHYDFPDHYTYTEQDIVQLLGYLQLHSLRRPGETIYLLTTEKDYYRLRGLDWFAQYTRHPFLYVPITLGWYEGEEVLQEKVRLLLKK